MFKHAIEHFFRVYMAWSKHEDYVSGLRNFRELILSTLRVLRWRSVNTEKCSIAFIK